ncbi:enoyl-CoA hydratase-related protein [Nocardioides caeni]|uniref:Enoyl-CoA hydratase n=1 Tax=Nocardioides caeni TaxID=574700 RepID=A0A4S8N343_9ACTN|nr:enoyl-CoA hydratase-related protein [Nocardioides caeni]THV09154.1 enoyl-CoA hydratase [Nocardioides caeni]
MTETAAELVHLEVADGVATITLDSPHNRNALSVQLVTELAAHLTTAGDDPEVRVVKLVSSGRVFCSGADLSAAATVPMHEGARAIVALQRQILSLSVPVVTVVVGAARAGGIGIVASSDVVVAAEDATFALTEVKLGLAPAVISPAVFGRMTPRGAALTALDGEVFTGAQAAEFGLVTLAVPADQLDVRVDEVVGRIATGALQGLRETKGLLNAGLIADLDARGEDLVQLSARLFGSDEAREAMTAFLSRKK